MSHDENAFRTQSLHISQKGSLANLFENSNKLFACSVCHSLDLSQVNQFELFSSPSSPPTTFPRPFDTFPPAVPRTVK